MNQTDKKKSKRRVTAVTKSIEVEKRCAKAIGSQVVRDLVCLDSLVVLMGVKRRSVRPLPRMFLGWKPELNST